MCSEMDKLRLPFLQVHPNRAHSPCTCAVPAPNNVTVTLEVTMDVDKTNEEVAPFHPGVSVLHSGGFIQFKGPPRLLSTSRPYLWYRLSR
jgi:hypothetical protein